MTAFRIVNGDSLEVLKKLPDDSISAIVTDPPYGLSNFKSKHVAEAITKWVSGERDFVPKVGNGFMGQSWDAFVPPPALWDECLRVLKPGGHMAVFAGTRTVDLMALGIRLAGFEIRDSLTWLYGTGFPKGQSVGKMIDKSSRGVPQGTTDPTSANHGKYKSQRTEGKRDDSDSGQGYGAGASTFLANGKHVETTRELVPEAAPWEGWSTAIKPASEPIVVARKPLAEKTVAKNVLKHGTGAYNIDATRIAHASEADLQESTTKNQHTKFASGPRENEVFGADQRDRPDYDGTKGRYPANVVLTHVDGCEQSGTTKVRSGTAVNRNRSGEKPNEVYGTWAESGGDDETYASEDGTETIPAWVCVPGCPVAELDEQSGDSKSTGTNSGRGAGTKAKESEVYGKYKGRTDMEQGAEVGYGDKGGASRFFYTAKASKKERPSYLDSEGKKIVHPTVKPLKLMQWLVRLITPPGGIVLDPFAGSGTTAEAAYLEDFSSLVIEAEAKFIPLIEKRMSKYEPKEESA